MENRLRRLCEINGVVGNSTEYIHENYFIPCDTYQDETLKDSPLLSPFNNMGEESEVWIKVELNFGNEYVQNFIIPHIYADRSCYLGLNLKDLDEKEFQKGITSLEWLGQDYSNQSSHDYPETAHPPIEDIVELSDNDILESMTPRDFVYFKLNDHGREFPCFDMYENLLTSIGFIDEQTYKKKMGLLSDEKVVLATNFHLKYDYLNKIPNITFDGTDGALNKALKSEFEFKLSEVELRKVHTNVRGTSKSKKI